MLQVTEKEPGSRWLEKLDIQIVVSNCHPQSPLSSLSPHFVRLFNNLLFKAPPPFRLENLSHLPHLFNKFVALSPRRCVSIHSNSILDIVKILDKLNDGFTLVLWVFIDELPGSFKGCHVSFMSDPS